MLIAWSLEPLGPTKTPPTGGDHRRKKHAAKERPRPVEGRSGAGKSGSSLSTPRLKADGARPDYAAADPHQCERRHGGCARLGAAISSGAPSFAAAGSRAIPLSGTFGIFTDCPDGRRLLDTRIERKEPMAEELRIRQSIWQKCCAAWKLTNRLLLQV